MKNFFFGILVWLIMIHSTHAQQPSHNLTELLQHTLDSTGERPIKSVFLCASIPSQNWSWCGVAGASDTATFRLASLTKTFTATLILQLVEEGKIEYDASITNFFPKRIVQQLHRFKGKSYGHQITIRRLLRHTTGLADYILGHPSIIEGAFKDSDRLWTPSALLQAYFDAGLAKKACFVPNDSAYKYSDTNYLLLGMIIEKVTGQSLAQTFHQRIFTPLELHSAYLEFQESAAITQQVTSPFWGSRNLGSANLSFDWGGGGLVMNNQELHRCWKILANGALLHQPSNRARLYDWVASPQPNAISAWYGGGLLKVQFSEMPALIGHSGFYKSFMAYFPTLDLYISGTLNQVEADHIQFIRSVLSKITKEFN